MQYVIQRNTDKYFYRGRRHYPPWVNDVTESQLYSTKSAAVQAKAWISNTQQCFLDVVPVEITIKEVVNV